MMLKVWKFGILIMLSIMTAYMPASACVAIPVPEFNRVDTVFWDTVNQSVTEQQFSGEFIGKAVFVERSGFQVFFSSNKGKFKVRVLESTTHPDLVGKTLLIVQPIDISGGGLCPPSMPGKLIGPSAGAQGTVRGALSPSSKNPNGISLIYHSYTPPKQAGEQ